jgi:uncharacterized membrane protein
MASHIKFLTLFSFLICLAGGGMVGGPLIQFEIGGLSNLGSMIDNEEYISICLVAFTLIAQIIGVAGLFRQSRKHDTLSLISTVILLTIALSALFISDLKNIYHLSYVPFLGFAFFVIFKYIRKYYSRKNNGVQ